MVTPRARILKAPGTNCDAETAFACRRVGFDVEILPVQTLLERPGKLDEADLFILPGGFSYGDDLGAGTVLAHELRRIREPLWQFIRNGRLVLGICNGFQVLTKAGLLPDPLDGRQTVALARNDSARFECRWTRLKVASTRSVFLTGETILELPVANGEGRFLSADPNQLDLMKRNGQIALLYVDEHGAVDGYPWNPNGSTDGIAGISDPTGHVLGLMPHPERFTEPEHHPEWTRRRIPEPHGLKLFRNAFEYIRRTA